MKLKRAKAYKKLLHQYELNFGFREPYQVLLDSQILDDAAKFKIDLVPRLEKVLGGKVKPMITTCDMRHLYNGTPKNDALIAQAKEFERRRCNHHELEEPLSSLECLSSVVDPKENFTNKHRYVVASNDTEVRMYMRQIAGVPLIYISKSVVLMEPMNSATEQQREREEKSKFKLGLKGQRSNSAGQKRKHEGGEDEPENQSIADQGAGDARPQKKKRAKGPKGPNPLSVKKPKSAATQGTSAAKAKSKVSQPGTNEGEGDTSGRKRRRKHKSKADDGAAAQDEGQTAEP